MQRAEVWWANLPSPIGRRPVVLISRDRAIQVRDVVIVAVVTRTIRDIPSEVLLTSEEGMPAECVANCDVLHTVPKTALADRITLLSTSKRESLDQALRFSLGLM